MGIDPGILTEGHDVDRRMKANVRNLVDPLFSPHCTSAGRLSEMEGSNKAVKSKQLSSNVHFKTFIFVLVFCGQLCGHGLY
jgi:hypothetical protein